MGASGCRLAASSTSEEEPVHADLWDTNPHGAFSTPMSARPGPQRPRRPTQEIRPKDDRGIHRLPAYVLIALGIAVVAITVAIVAVLVGFD
jgi:hypothetical protein